MTHPRFITHADIMSPETYAKEREKLRKDMIALKKKRRLAIGPDIMIYFENKQTLLWQIHEMLHIEKGGEEQITDELQAYNPLIPQGHELVATLMIEIDDLHRRRVTLAQLGHIEHAVQLEFEGVLIKGMPTDDMERTTEEGKTSSVHFLHFKMTPEQASTFKQAKGVTLSITHPRYSYATTLPDDMHQELVQDL